MKDSALVVEKVKKVTVFDSCHHYGGRELGVALEKPTAIYRLLNDFPT